MTEEQKMKKKKAKELKELFKCGFTLPDTRTASIGGQLVSGTLLSQSKL